MTHLAYSDLTKRLYFNNNGKKVDITDDVKEYLQYISSQEGSKLAIDTNPLVKKMKREMEYLESIKLTEFGNGALHAYKELLPYINNVQVVQPAKTDGGEPVDGRVDHFLNCPFCGGRPQWINLKHPNGIPAINCPECQFTIHDDRRDKIQFRWNRRVQPDSVKGTPVDLDDPFVKKHLAAIWEKTKQAQIHRFIDPMYSTLRAASISHFLESGKVSGSFHQALNEMMDAVKSWGKIEITMPHTDKQEGMRWVNGAERLPKSVIDLRIIARYVATRTIVYDFAEFVKHQPQNLKLVEWLDESPSIGADNGREAKAVLHWIIENEYEWSESSKKWFRPFEEHITTDELYSQYLKDKNK